MAAATDESARTEFDAAIEVQESWKRHLQDEITLGRTNKATASVADDATACAFGNWLAGFEATGRDQRNCERVKRADANFHRAAGDVVGKVERENLVKAHRILEKGRFRTSSAALITRLKE